MRIKVAEHDRLGAGAGHQRSDAMCGAVARKHCLGAVRLGGSTAAARQTHEPRADGMPALVNRDAPNQLVHPASNNRLL